MAKHYTTSKLSENISETPEGFLLCHNVPMARTGEMIYGDGETPLEVGDDGQVIVHRHADDVFHPDTIASFEGKAVTIKHPEDFVSPENWSSLAKGIIQNVRRGEGLDEDGEESLVADLLITDKLAIELIKAGLREVSCGYEAEYEQTGKGKGRQTRIIGNHLALVEQGRAGQAYAINDHKGKGTMSKLADTMKKLLGQVVDEAVAEEKKAKDEDKKDDEKKDESKDAGAYDELVKMVKDLGEKVEAMGKPKDEKEAPKEEPKKEEAAKDEGEEEAPAEKSMEERMKALETAVAKLMEMLNDEGEESEDDDFEESDMTGDATKDAAAKSQKTGLEGTKNSKAFDHGEAKTEIMTAEKINEINAAHWARK